MKNVINYFYNLSPNNIHQNKEEYFFEVNNIKYMFQECSRSLEELYELYNLQYYLYNKEIYLHQMILNNNKDLVTTVNEKKYVLMRVFYDDNKKVTINDIEKISNIKIIDNYNYIKRENWRELWMKKIDYLEYQIEQNKNKYYIFSNDIDYFIGLTENAIQLLENRKMKDLYITHQRITSNMKVIELYNPLNIVLDNKIRDICEYYKDRLIKKKDIEIEIIKYLERNKNNEELFLFFVRFIYVTKYFDLFDKVLVNYEEVKVKSELLFVINEITTYEQLVKKIYKILYNRGILPEIEWLKKNKFSNLF